MKKIIAFVLLALLIVSKQVSYMRLPLIRHENITHSVHDIELEINQYPYSLDINFRGEKDYILSLEEAKQTKSKTSSQDFKRSQDGVYGIAEFIRVEEADSRMTFLEKTKKNAYFFVRDLLPQQTWISFRGVSQIKGSSNPNSMTEGTVNLADPSHSPFINSLKRYNPQVKGSIISFRLNSDNKNGELFVGAFPLGELANSKDFAEVEVKNDHQNSWKVNVESIRLKTTSKVKDDSSQNEIFKVPVQFKLSTSEKTLQLPKIVCENIAKTLKNCEMKIIGQQKLLTCSRSTFQQQKLRVSILIFFLKNKVPLKMRLQDLQREGSSSQVVFNIRQGEEIDFHLSSLMLKEYLVGLDFKKGIFFFGKKKGESFVTRFLLLKLFIAGNIIALILSAFILTFAYVFKPGSSESSSLSSPAPLQKHPQVYTVSKASGYQMAALGQQGVSGHFDESP